MITLEKCAEIFGENIHPEHLCADGSGKKSTCEGDSGGPIVTRGDNNENILIGVASGGDDGCEEGYLSVFTRIYAYKDLRQVGLKA